MGSVYSYRSGAPYTPNEIVAHLSAGRGAGNSKALFDLFPSCVDNECTGIDCSQFLSMAWAISQDQHEATGGQRWLDRPWRP
jgi:hypothetical protein